MWPINSHYAPHVQQPPGPWPNGPPPYPSTGQGLPEIPTNSLKRSYSERQSVYNQTPAAIPSSQDPSSTRSRFPGPASPGAQFKVTSNSYSSFTGHTHAPPARFLANSRARPHPPDEIDRQTELFTSGAAHTSPPPSPVPLTIAHESRQAEKEPVSASAISTPTAAQQLPRPQARSPVWGRAPVETEATRSSTRISPFKSPAKPTRDAKSPEEPKADMELRKVLFENYLSKEESDLFTDYYNSASTSIKRANHISDVDKLDNFATNVRLSEKSPFTNFKSTKLGTGSLAKSKTAARERRLAHHVFNENVTKAPERIFSYPVHTFSAPTYQIPPYTHYVSSKRNTLVEGAKQRTFLPYLGETDAFDTDYQALEGKITTNQTKVSELHASEEFAKPWILKIDRVLSDLGTSTAAVLRLLIDEDRKQAPSALPIDIKGLFDHREDWIVDGFYEEEDDIEATRADHADDSVKAKKRPQKQWRTALENLPRVDDRALAAAVLACYCFMNVSGFSLWHVVRLTSVAEKACQPPTYSSEDTTPALNAYLDQACLICKAHRCSGHGEYSDDSDGERQRILMTSNFSDEKVYAKAARAMESRDIPNEVDLKLLLGRDKDGVVAGIPWTYFDEDDAGIEDKDLCSLTCFWNKSERTQATVDVAWSPEDEDLLKLLGPTLVSHKRGACALSRMGVFKRTCAEIFNRLVSMSQTPEEGQAAKRLEGRSHDNKTWQWWLASDTWKHDHREPFQPCNHVGKCKENNACSCNMAGISCEKSCNCASVCTRRFRGCRCHAMKKACVISENCDCVKLNRECDPDLCFNCGADVVLDPANRYDEQAVKGKCANVSIQRNVPKCTQLGQSKLLSAGGVVGWGLFMGEEAKKGDYIGEYIGEIVTLEEAEQRGIIYNAMNMSYLFDLNKEQVLDSTPIGNKLRYINHQGEDFANCQAKVMFCGGVQRIAIYCTRNIRLGEELLFNYGDGFASKIDMVTYNKDGTVVIEKAAKGADSGKTTAHKKLSNGVGKTNKPPKTGFKRKGTPNSGLDGNEDAMDVDEESSAAEMGLADGEDEDEDDYDEPTHKSKGKLGKSWNHKPALGPSGMTASDRMRKAWISRYRNRGMLDQAKAQQKKFDKNLGT